jgi:hypothetical protein
MGLDYRLGPTRMAIVFQKDIPYKIPGPELQIGPTIKIQRVSLSLQKRDFFFYNSKAHETMDPGPKNKANEKIEK